jgi:hypothetical protein
VKNTFFLVTKEPLMGRKKSLSNRTLAGKGQNVKNQNVKSQKEHQKFEKDQNIKVNLDF